MKGLAVSLALSLLVLSLGAGSVGAQGTGLAYDIFDRAGNLTAWLDLAPLLDSRTVEQLKDGIDLILDYQVSAGIPRRFLGDRRVARQTNSLLIRYRPVTEDFILEVPNDSGQSPRQYISLAGLHQFLHDSIEVALAALDSLEASERYVLDVQIASISLTDINIGADRKPHEEAESPVKYLFRRFLDVTGYGREEYEVRSRPFALSELEHLN